MPSLRPNAATLVELWNRRPWNPIRHPSQAPPQVAPPHSQVVLKHKYVVALFLFLVCVDLIEIVGVLCYQLFTASYFPWHLYPMMLNRAMEIIALICSRGYVPSLYSAAQILLSLLSLAVYAKRQPCGKYHCAVPLVLYSILLSYETFVAVMVIKVSRMPMANDEGQIIANWPTFQVSPLTNTGDQGIQPIGMQIMRLSPRMIRDRIIGPATTNAEVSNMEISMPHQSYAFDKFIDPRELIVAVQQPDGEKMQLAIAKLCDDTRLEVGHDDEAASSEPSKELVQEDEDELPGILVIPTSTSLRQIMNREDELDDELVAAVAAASPRHETSSQV